MGWLDFDLGDVGSALTDWGGEGLPGELETDTGTGGGWGGAVDFLSGLWDQAGNVVDAYQDVAGAFATGGIGGAIAEGARYATGTKKGKVPGAAAKKAPPRLDVSLAIKEPAMSDGLAEYGAGGTDSAIAERTNSAYPNDPWTLPQLCANSGITTKKVCWAIKRFGSAIVPYLIRYLQTDSSTFMAAYLSSRCIVGGRRRRGISYRQLANARRVNHTIAKMYHQLHRGRSFH